MVIGRKLREGPAMYAHNRRNRGKADPWWLPIWMALDSIVCVFLHNLVVLGRALRYEADFQRGQCPQCVAARVGHARRYELKTNHDVHKFSCTYINTPSQWHNFIWR